MSRDRPNFKIVETSYDDYSDIYDDFKRDYLSEDITVKEMIEKYGISKNKYMRIKKVVAEETGVNRKISRNTTGSLWSHYDKYIERHKALEKYKVSKVIGGTLFFYGIYDSLEDALFIRDRLEECDWSMDCYRKLRYELFNEESLQDKIRRVYIDFKDDYMEGESIKYLMKKYDLTISMYKILSKMIRSEEGLLRKPQLHYKVARQHERDLHRQG